MLDNDETGNWHYSHKANRRAVGSALLHTQLPLADGIWQPDELTGEHLTSLHSRFEKSKVSTLRLAAALVEVILDDGFLVSAQLAYAMHP